MVVSWLGAVSPVITEYSAKLPYFFLFIFFFFQFIIVAGVPTVILHRLYSLVVSTVHCPGKNPLHAWELGWRLWSALVGFLFSFVGP